MNSRRLPLFLCRRPRAWPCCSTSTVRWPARHPECAAGNHRRPGGLAAAGVPVIFNTGRSDAFIREQVMEPMIAAGMPAGT